MPGAGFSSATQALVAACTGNAMRAAALCVQAAALTPVVDTRVLAAAAQAMIEVQLDVTDLRSVLAIVRTQTARLDAITQPHLLHGDLWLFNLLVSQEAEGISITGVLDADRAWWGDPLADWTMFVLSMEAPEKHPGHDRFWQAYGEPEQTPETALRKAVYEAMHIGTAMAWASRHADDDTVERGKGDLRAVLKRLQSYDR